MSNKILICIFLFVSSWLINSNLFAEQVLTPEEAVSIGLKNNFDIQISRNDLLVNKTNNTAGNAGMYPELNLAAGANIAINDAYLVYSNGNITDKPSSTVKGINASIGLNWTIFDGFKMFTTKSKLNQIEQAGELKFQNQIQQSTAQILASYYEIVRQKQILNAIKEIKALSRERMIISETRFKSGFAPKTDFLQAQIDYNSQLQNEIQQENVISDAKRELNKLINRDIAMDFDVSDSVNLINFDSSTVEQRIMEKNPSLLLLKKELGINELSTRESVSKRYPWLNLSGAYSFSQSENNAGFVTSNRNIGPNLSLNLDFPLYKGGDISREIQLGEIESKILELRYESAKNDARAQFESAYKMFTTNLRLLEIENQTKILAKENLTLSIERLKLSQTTSLEVRDAQVSYENSLSRLSNIYFSLKSAETKLKLLMGEL